MMEYKGYVAKVEFDNEAGIFHGQVLNIRDVITFQGRSVDELRQEFANSVEDYLEFCAERGEAPEKPFSGRFMVRLTPELHRSVAIAASHDGLSINSWVARALQEATGQRDQHRRNDVGAVLEQLDRRIYGDVWHEYHGQTHIVEQVTVSRHDATITPTVTGPLIGAYQQRISYNIVKQTNSPTESLENVS
jgi:predicted HicB family RNase H-like nuclease